MTEGRREEERVYLSVDSDALGRLARDKWGLDEGFEDFLIAIRRQLGVRAEHQGLETPLSLPPQGDIAGGVPVCTAFLAFLVVCAARRGERVPEYPGGGTELFFPWVRHLLGGKPVATRSGLGELDATPAPEPALWRRWARYLERRGFRSVPETSYQGPKAVWGYALDQAILTYSCRTTLAALTVQERRALRGWARRRETGRRTDPPLARATKHLLELLVDRWEDEHVREAILGAVEGAPPGPRPGRHHLFPIRRALGRYCLRVEPPAGWSRTVYCGDKPIRGCEVLLPPTMLLPELRFQVGDAFQEVRWYPPSFLRFLVSIDELSPSREGEPELGEGHFLLAPVEELLVLEQARGQGWCGWEDRKCWGGWIEFEGFRMEVPRIATRSGVLTVKSHGGLVFEGGIRTGESGRTPRILAAHLGGVRAAEGAGVVGFEETGGNLDVSAEAVTPLPELKPGPYHFVFGSKRRGFEVVDWRTVVYNQPGEPAWLR